MQHDVQEFNRVLCDKLETKMKGTPVEGTINFLLEGKMKSFVKCTQVTFESSREESFYGTHSNEALFPLTVPSSLSPSFFFFLFSFLGCCARYSTEREGAEKSQGVF